MSDLNKASRGFVSPRTFAKNRLSNFFVVTFRQPANLSNLLFLLVGGSSLCNPDSLDSLDSLCTVGNAFGRTYSLDISFLDSFRLCLQHQDLAKGASQSTLPQY